MPTSTGMWRLMRSRSAIIYTTSSEEHNLREHCNLQEASVTCVIAHKQHHVHTTHDHCCA